MINIPIENPLNKCKSAVEKELTIFFNKKLAESEKISPESKQIVELLKDYSLRGGKRIRAALVYYGYKCFSNKNIKEIIKASAAMELIQSYLLVHDDIIDRDDLRRNGPTIHKSYKDIFKKIYPSSDSVHLGNSMAILAGDLASSFANELINDIDIKEKYKAKASKKMNKVVKTVIFGELLDIISALRPVTKIEIEKIHRFKTASYTIEGPLHIGALLAGAKNKDLKVLSGYAVPLGEAFQLQDDILGLYGNEKQLGKPIGSDLREGKYTLLILKALEKATKLQKEKIKKALGSQKLTKKQLDGIRKIVKQTGSLKYSQYLVQKLVSQSKKSIKGSRFNKEAKQFLLELADYMLKREY